jgi:surface polysaccharide O-acyltransferase-like enzyme
LNRKAWVNVRGAAVLGVVLIHITGLFLRQDSGFGDSFYLVLNQLSRFAVPMFFIASGYGLTISRSYTGDLGTYLKKRMKIVPAYLMWTFVYLIVHHTDWSLKSIMGGIFLGNSSYHMYFITVLILFYLIYPILHNFCTTYIGITIMLLITLAGQAFFLSGSTFGKPYFWNWLFYFGVGIFMAYENHLNLFLKCSKSLLLLGLIAILGTSFYFKYVKFNNLSLSTTSMRPAVMLYTLGVVAFMLNWYSKPFKVFSVFDANSLNIYYVHPIMLMIIQKLLQGTNTTNFESFLIMLAFVLIVSLLFSMSYRWVSTKIRLLFRRVGNTL